MGRRPLIAVAAGAVVVIGLVIVGLLVQLPIAVDAIIAALMLAFAVICATALRRIS